MATPITLTDAAGKRLASIQEAAGAVAVRIALKKGGCAGMEYTLDPIQTVPAMATTVEREGAILVVDPLAEMFLFGTEIDHKDTLLESGFVFRNPNVQSTCGCGASVGF
jgi:iron-sulfur cluster assembly protein